MKKLPLILISSLLLLASCQVNTNPISYNVSNVFNIDNQPVNPFNTAIALTMFNQRQIDNKFPEFENEIHRLHRLFDSYNYYEVNNQKLINLKVINDSYGTGTSLKVEPEILELITQAVQMMKLTEGYFNPTLGTLIDIWSPLFVPFLQELGEDPDSNKIDAALKCSANINNIDEVIVIDNNSSTIQFNKIPGCDGPAKLALGAIAKGFAMEKVKTLLGDQPYLIDGGRSSLITNGINPNPDRDNWNVVVLTPYLGVNLAISSISGSATFTTSGDYENSFLKQNPDGTTIVRHHILNPFSGYSQNYYRSFTILSDSQAGIMDALGTALFNIEDLSLIKKIIQNVESEFNVKIDFMYQQEVKVDSSNKLIVSLTQGFDKTLMQDTVSSLVVEKRIIN